MVGAVRGREGRAGGFRGREEGVKEGGWRPGAAGAAVDAAAHAPLVALAF